VKRAKQTQIAAWILFAVVQALGVVIPRLTNIHSNIWPLFGFLFLVPGIALVTVVGLTWGVVFAIPVNAVAWYFAMSWLSPNSDS
jgi:hypothetical protein